MDSDETAQAFNKGFMQVYQRFYRRVKPTAFRPGPETLAVLRHLHGSGPLTVTEAAHHFSRSQAAMSEIVDRIEKRGLVQRIADQRDRRRKLVWLTPAGEKAHGEATRVLSLKKLEHAFAQLTPAQRIETAAVFRRLLATEPATEGWDDE